MHIREEEFKEIYLKLSLEFEGVQSKGLSGTGAIMLTKPDNDDWIQDQHVGYIEYTIYQRNDYTDCDELIMEADSNGEDGYMINFITYSDSVKKKDKFKNVMIITELNIYSNYRSKFYTHGALEQLMRHAKMMGINYIVLSSTIYKELHLTEYTGKYKVVDYNSDYVIYEVWRHLRAV